MTVIEKKEKRISKRGALSLSKEYFTPGEKISSQLEIDSKGNIKMVITKRLFNFGCDDVKELAGDEFRTEYDKSQFNSRAFSARYQNLTLRCIKSAQDLEPVHVSISKAFKDVNSKEGYLRIKEFLAYLVRKEFDAYLELDGDLDSINVFKELQRYNFKDEVQAIEALNRRGKKTGFSVILRFNGKDNTLDQIKDGLMELRSERQLIFD